MPNLDTTRLIAPPLPDPVPSVNWSLSGAKHEGTAGPFFAGNAGTTAFTFINDGAGDKILIVDTPASYDGVVDVHVGRSEGDDSLANIDDITPGNFGVRVVLKDLQHEEEIHVTFINDAEASTEEIKWCVRDPFFVVPENTANRNEYDSFIPDVDPFSFITWENPNDLTQVVIRADGDREVIFGNFASPQTVTIPDLKAMQFIFHGDGWFPAFEETQPTSQFYRELSSWNVNGTNTRVHKPQLIGNVEVVGVEDADDDATRYIWKDTDLPLDGPRYVRLRVRLDPANTTSMMFRAARPSNPCEFIIDLASGDHHVDQSGAAPVPVVIKDPHITADFAEYLIRFPQLTDATLWQLYPSVGPNGITNRNLSLIHI